nr:MAG TPA: hypothetical protein [Caudoviricetes sp.]
MQACNVSFLLSLCSNLCFSRGFFKFGSLKGYPRHHGLRNLVVRRFACGSHCRVEA